MQDSLIKILTLTIICLSSSTAYAASIIPICSENKPLNSCSKNKLSFPTYPKDENGKATFSYKIDQGGLGEFNSDEAVLFTTNVLNLWSQQSSIVFEKVGNGIFETDIDESNFTNYVDQEQGFNLIIWDKDGDIIDDLAGTGAREFILGYATPIAYNYKKNKIESIKESQTLLNGFLFNRNSIGGSRSSLENLFRTTILHELAHMFGLDHAQGGNLEGYNNREGDYKDIPVMFPVAANPEVALHADDIAAIKLAYPKSEDTANLGSISGSFTRSSVPIEGANIVAYKLGETNPKKYAVSSPSDVDGFKEGNYLLPNLSPGSYVLYAEPLDKDFKGGSSIGFHESPANFTAGFYGPSNDFLNLSFEEGLLEAQVITVNANSSFNIDIDIEGKPGNGNGSNNGDASFVSGGRLISGSPIRLKNRKNKVSKIKIVNLDPGNKLNIKISTDYPELINFKGTGSYGFKKRSKKIKVKLASFNEFIENPAFEALIDFGSVSIPVTVEDLDTGFRVEETLVIQ